MCCVLYCIYRKCCAYFKKRRTRVENTNLPETLYTASMLDNHVKNKQLSAVWEV